MKFLKSTILLLMILSFHRGHAQNFAADLKKLDSEINAARKAGKLTELEYGKLKNEQETIKLAIAKANADNVVTPAEKNKIHSKIVRSKKRLIKYKNNREIY